MISGYLGGEKRNQHGDRKSIRSDEDKTDHHTYQEIGSP